MYTNSSLLAGFHIYVDILLKNNKNNTEANKENLLHTDVEITYL